MNYITLVVVLLEWEENNIGILVKRWLVYRALSMVPGGSLV